MARPRACRGHGGRQLQQAEYEARRAFEQYDEVDPRNRLVAADLEARWNGKLEEVEELKNALAGLDAQVPAPTPVERATITALGEQFDQVWHSGRCPVELKKKIQRTVIEEVIVDLEDETQTLSFVLHWKGPRLRRLAHL